MKKDELKYWLAFSAVGGVGSKTFIRMLNYFSSAEEAWRSSRNELSQAGLKIQSIEKIINERDKINPDDELKLIEKLELKTVTIQDQEYPKHLKEIPDLPFLLYYKGDIYPEDELALAVVGSRKFSSYGKIVCEKIIPELVNNGLTIVSGLAIGIDTFAHRIAVEKNGRTIAVLAGGLDKIYPSANFYLTQKIINGHGSIISEYHPGTPSYATNFPVRNRIIAGLSMGILLIEASEKSGSLLTAQAALAYNREVFAVPGDINRETSRGTNGLLKIGAKMVTSANDVLDELRIERKSKEVEAKKIIPDTKEEALILRYLNRDPIHIDKLVALINLDISKLNSTLVMMEIKGKVRNLGANQYIINR